jgi:hypothetical protein
MSGTVTPRDMAFMFGKLRFKNQDETCNAMNRAAEPSELQLTPATKLSDWVKPSVEVKPDGEVAEGEDMEEEYSNWGESEGETLGGEALGGERLARNHSEPHYMGRYAFRGQDNDGENNDDGCSDGEQSDKGPCGEEVLSDEDPTGDYSDIETMDGDILGGEDTNQELLDAQDVHGKGQNFNSLTPVVILARFIWINEVPKSLDGDANSKILQNQDDSKLQRWIDELSDPLSSDYELPLDPTQYDYPHKRRIMKLDKCL